MNDSENKNKKCNARTLPSFTRQTIGNLRRSPPNSVPEWNRRRPGQGSQMSCDLSAEQPAPALKASRKPFKLRGLAGKRRCGGGLAPLSPLIDLDPISSTRIRFDP